MIVQTTYPNQTPPVLSISTPQSPSVRVEYARTQPADLDDLLSVLDEATNDLERLMLHKEKKLGGGYLDFDLFSSSQKQLLFLIRDASQYFEHSKHLIGSKYRFEYKLNRAEAVFKESKKFKPTDPNW
jgi:hypothetical protein